VFSPRPPRGDGAVREILQQILAHVHDTFARDPRACYWQAVSAALAAVGEDASRAAKMEPDESFFWEYLCVDIMSAVITQTRLQALAAADHPIAVYGQMFDPQSAQMLAPHPNLVAKGAAHYITELPRLNRRTKVTLDVVTAHFPTSTTAKILNCFASGGLCLFDAKPAFAEAFGAVAEHVMYRDYDDMNAKLDHLLSHDRERHELIDHVQAKVRAEHTMVGLIAEAVTWIRETRA
jgi:hypothetical protein